MGEEQISEDKPYDIVSVIEQDEGVLDYSNSQQPSPKQLQLQLQQLQQRKPTKKSNQMELSASISADTELTVRLRQLFGMDQFSCTDRILVSITMLSGRKTTKQTKLHRVTTTGTVDFNQTFHFQPFQQDDESQKLMRSCRIRFRVYGRVSSTLVICIGQLVVNLSEEDMVSGEVQLEAFVEKVLTKKLKYYRE